MEQKPQFKKVRKPKKSKSAKKNQRRQRTAPKPKYTVLVGEIPYLLAKRPNRKHGLDPLTPEQQSNYLPSGCTAREVENLRYLPSIRALPGTPEGAEAVDEKDFKEGVQPCLQGTLLRA